MALLSRRVDYNELTDSLPLIIS